MSGNAFPTKSRQPGSPESPLTEREIDVLRMVATGCTSKEVGLSLSISIKTVESHRSRIMRKLQASGVVELVHYAIRIGIVKA
jgi:two-component system, NarL family, response regulator NreC